MNKQEFLAQLRENLWAMPKADAQASVEYYGEMIDDRMEEGLSEEEAVAAVGDAKEIAKNILASEGTAEPKEKKRPTMGWRSVLLLTLGAPIWLSLLVAAAAVVVSVLVSLWSVVLSVYATCVSLGAAALGCIFGSFFLSEMGLAALGAALICAGLMILVFLLGNLAAKGMLILTKLTWKGVKRCFRRKEQAV